MDNFLAEIRIFPYNRIPNGWMACNGQSLPIRQYQAVYSLISINYGGDGVNNFLLPNLNGRVMVGQGVSSKSGQNYIIGKTGGAEAVVLTNTTMPSHNHTINAATTYDLLVPKTNFPGNPNNPTAAVITANINKGNVKIYSPTVSTTALHPASVTNTGGGQPHENRMPFVALVYCIAVMGLYPQRS